LNIVGGELADPAADRLGELAAADHARGDVALGGATRAGEGVQAERLARHHQCAVDLGGHHADVLPAGGVADVGREAADLLRDAQGWASSVVKSAGTGPVRRLRVRGGRLGQHGHELLGEVGRGRSRHRRRGDDGDRAAGDLEACVLGAAAEDLELVAHRGLQAAGSMVTASSPSSGGVNASDAAIAATGTSADVPSEPSMPPGADSAGVTVSSSTRWASAGRRGPWRRRPAARSGCSGRRRGEGGGDRVGGPLAVQRPAVGGVDDARRRAVDGDRGVDRRAVDLAASVSIWAASAVSSPVMTGATRGR
jgi:hypothetical protein